MNWRKDKLVLKSVWKQVFHNTTSWWVCRHQNSLDTFVEHHQMMRLQVFWYICGLKRKNGNHFLANKILFHSSLLQFTSVVCTVTFNKFSLHCSNWKVLLCNQQIFYALLQLANFVCSVAIAALYVTMCLGQSVCQKRA